MIPKEAKPNQTETKTKPQPLSFSSLPDEILENILVRLSKWNYPNLSLVSKRFLSLLSSTELYTTRSHIGTTEPCLYFCLGDLTSTPHPKWFTLWIKPADETLAEEDDEILEDYSLVSVPSSPHPQHVPYFSTVAVGSDIYLIGGAYKPSSRVRIFDCRSHTWRDGPNMLVAREEAYACYIDGKIYVMEDDRKDNNWMEVLDIKTQTWSPLLSHGATEFRDDWSEEYKTKGIRRIWCGKIAFEKRLEGEIWGKMEWVNEVLTFTKPYKSEEYKAKQKRRIWCAKIAFEKRHEGEIWGKMEWVNEVLTPASGTPINGKGVVICKYP
ncbi:hypothetical protein Bca4012_023933 [Brassica carinata]